MTGGRRARGQAVIIIAAGMPVLFALLALLVDLGFSFATREKVRAAADSSAVAAGRAMGLGQTDAQVKAAIDYYAAANGADVDWADNPAMYLDATGVDLAEVGNGSVPAAAAAVRVPASRTQATFFAGVLGRSTLAVSQTAIGGIGAVTVMEGAVSLGVPDIAYQNGVTYWIGGDNVHWQTYGSDRRDVGIVNFRPGRSRKADLEADLTYGYGSALRLEDLISNTYDQPTADLKKVMKRAISTRLTEGRTLVISPAVYVNPDGGGGGGKGGGGGGKPRGESKTIVGFVAFNIDTPNNRSGSFDGENVDGIATYAVGPGRVAALLPRASTGAVMGVRLVGS